MVKKFDGKQQGAGLIEVLAGTVVIAVGLLSVASLQTGLVAGSGNTKIRLEALALAGQKLEELNAGVGKAGYEANSAGSFSETVQGSNTEFTRDWRISDEPAFAASLPPRKKISVQVSWQGDGSEAERSIRLSSGTAWIDPFKTALLTEINAAMAQNGEAKPGKPNVAATILSSQAIESLSLLSGETPGKDKQIRLNLKFLRGDKSAVLDLQQIAADSHYYATAQLNPFASGPGAISVFWCEGLNCRFVDNVLGGIPLRIAGAIYSAGSSELSRVQVFWTANGIARACYTQPLPDAGTGATQAQAMSYECLVAGNCNATADGLHGCYPDTAVSDEQINAYGVPTGGEFGAVGLLGLSDQPGSEEQVCFLEDLADTGVFYNPSGGLNNAYLQPASKRQYAAKRLIRENGNNRVQDEGINRSYVGHDFLISLKASTPAGNRVCRDQAAALGVTPGPREIVRTFTQTQANAVLAEQVFSGGPVYSLSGAITRSGEALSLFIAESGSCHQDNAAVISDAATQFACVTVDRNADIEGASTRDPGSQAVFAECTPKTAESVCDWPGSFVFP